MDKLSADELAEELSALYRLSPDLICVADGEGKFRRLNPAWEKALGYTPDELVGRRWLEFVHPDDRAGTLDVARSQDKADVLEFKNRYRAKDGSWVTLSWRASAITRGLVYAVVRVVP